MGDNYLRTLRSGHESLEQFWDSKELAGTLTERDRENRKEARERMARLPQPTIEETLERSRETLEWTNELSEQRSRKADEWSERQSQRVNEWCEQQSREAAERSEKLRAARAADPFSKKLTEASISVLDRIIRENQPKPKDAPKASPAAIAQKDTRPKRLPSTIGSPGSVRRLDEFLLQKGFGVTEFSVLADVNERSVRKFRSGGKIRRDIFEAIAKAMKLTKDEFLKS